MVQAMDRMSRLFFENIARAVSQKEFLYLVFTDIFQGMMVLARSPFQVLFASTGWCELQVAKGFCNMANGKPCSSSCMGGSGSSMRCPAGYKASFAWGYRVTGCWCDTYRGMNVVCCDCTPASNSPYVRTAHDCGCMHVL